MRIEIPKLSLIVLIGASGSGKSTFARKHFRATEILSSDVFRGMVADDPTDQSASKAAFDALHYVAEKRLAAGKLTVVDATHVKQEDRKQLISMAKRHHAILVGILFDLPTDVCENQNQQREPKVSSRVIRRQIRQLQKGKHRIRKEGFRYFYTFKSSEEINQATVERIPLKVDRTEEEGPFDIIGDIHGCFQELCMLLEKLGYHVKQQGTGEETSFHVYHPEGRKLIFLGDLVDRGPDSLHVLQLVMDMVDSGNARCVMGNHDERLLRKLKGRNVQIKYGLERTLEQMKDRSPDWMEKVKNFLEQLPHHYVLNGGRLVVAHAGLIEQYHGRHSGAVRSFALYGDPTGERDEYGFPIRRNWAEDYHGQAMVVYGHTPVEKPVFQNRTVNIDTGCVFGGHLTAFRYPENKCISVPSQEDYADLGRPFFTKNDFRDQLPSMLHIYGKRRIETRFHSPILIYEDQTAAVLEEVSRFAVDPRWMIYLPPTMSPSETATDGDRLEHPQDAFQYYRQQGLNQVICEEKHMGSRAIVIVCRDEQVAFKRFGIKQERIGICYTRTGRRFFQDGSLEHQFLKRIQMALTQSRFWEQMDTDWVCLDCELMPWSAKARELLKNQYAAVGTAAKHSLAEVLTLLEQTKQEGREVDHLLQLFHQKKEMNERFINAYRQYCWPVTDLSDYRLAPFHLLATEGKVYWNRNHIWHMETIAQFCAKDPELLVATPYQIVDLHDPLSIEETNHWWEKLTSEGGEGIVVKPINFLEKGERGLIQPAIKCRGREYLRIIYGFEYTFPDNLQHLRKRGLKKKRSLAIREFVLGLEALERFVNGEPLGRVHECCYGILALESEPVDPRL